MMLTALMQKSGLLFLAFALATNHAGAGYLPNSFHSIQTSRIEGAGRYDDLGFSLASNSDYVVAGAINVDGETHAAGTVYIYYRDETNLISLSQQLFAPPEYQTNNQSFGWSVDLAEDTLVVGTNEILDTRGDFQGVAYVYKITPTGFWELAARLVSSPPSDSVRRGRSLYPSTNGAVIAQPVFEYPNYDTGRRAPESQVHVYRSQMDGAWVSSQVIRMEDLPGNYATLASVLLHGDRMLLTTGRLTPVQEEFESSVIVLEDDGEEFSPAGSLLPLPGEENNSFGRTIATEGDRVFVGVSAQTGEGLIAVYEPDSHGVWDRVYTIESPVLAGDYAFGYQLDVVGDFLFASGRSFGETIAEPVVHVFGRQQDGAWLELERIVKPPMFDYAFDSTFGWTIAADSEAVYVGTGINAPGSIYTFVGRIPEPTSATLAAMAGSFLMVVASRGRGTSMTDSAGKANRPFG